MKINRLLCLVVILELVSAVSIHGQLRARRRGVPNAQNVEKQRIAGLDVAVWKPVGSAPAPLVVFSHGFRGCNTQTVFLMDALADAGYLVVAPNHKDASCGGRGGLSRAEEPFRDPLSWTDKTYKDRATDVSRLLDGLRADKQGNNRIDWARVGLAGHSLGGYTVRGSAGAWPAWKLSGVRAVLALSPYCDPFVQHGNLETISVPVMYQGGTRDVGITPTVKRLGEGCYAKTSAPAYFVEFDKAGHFAWTNLVADYQQPIVHYSVAFFDRFLRGDSKVDLTQRLSAVSDLRSK